MTYGLNSTHRENPLSQASLGQHTSVDQERAYNSTRRCSDAQILNLLPYLSQQKISYYESKAQINEGTYPQWLANITSHIDMSESDIAFLMSNLKDIAPDSSMRIMNKKY